MNNPTINNPEHSISLYETLNDLTKEIRAGLKFAPGTGIGEDPTKGNCYEFALRTEASLAGQSQHSLSSAVVYVHDHALNAGNAYGSPFVLSSDVPALLATGEESDRISEVFLPDDDNPELNPQDAIDRINTLGSVACYFNMANLRHGIMARPAAMDKIGEYNEWFSSVWLKASLPTVTIMDPEFARDALSNYFQFRKGLGDPDLLDQSLKADFEIIRDALEDLRIRTPQNETRPRYNRELGLFRKAINKLARKGGVSPDDLSGVVDQYVEILPTKNTAANIVFGDCYRTIGTAKNSQSALDRAEVIYGRALGYTGKKHAKDMIRSKIGKTKAGKSKLAGA